jgi:beta-glucosidase
MPGNASITEDLEINFAEGNYIDYKYFDNYNITPQYESGYRLSYPTCDYSTQVSAAHNTTALFGGPEKTAATSIQTLISLRAS